MSTRSREFIGYGKSYPQIAWPGGARIAVSLVVNFEEGSERSPLNADEFPEGSGDGFFVWEKRRDVRNESSFDYGSRRGFWRLMGIFDRLDVKVTFFICAMALELNPGAARQITARDHEPCSHGYRWIPSYTLNRDEEREHIRRAVESIQTTTGQRPLGWFSRNPSDSTRELLAEEGGFVYECDSMADDLPYFVDVGGKRVLIIPYTLDNNDGRFARSPGYSEPNDFFPSSEIILRYPLQGGRNASQDDVGRAPHALCRTAGARNRGGGLYPIRQKPPGRVVSPPHRHRAMVAGKL